MSPEQQDSMSLSPDYDECSAYRITIKPGATQMLPLVFVPTSVSEYAFPLPLFVSGLPTYSAIRRVVNAEGVKPKVVLSHSHVDFGERIVMRRSMGRQQPYRMQVTITNDEMPEVHWHLDKIEESVPAHLEDSDEDSASVDDFDLNEDGITPRQSFSVEPANGILSLGESTAVTVKFSPGDPGMYREKIGLFLGGDTEEPYFQLDLKGSAAHPMLKFDLAEVALPIVPLNIRSSAKVYVSSHGYESLDLRYHMPHDTVALPLDIDFPDGTMLGHGRKRVPVVIGFQSSRPMAFACTIDFLDTNNHRFSLPISACADNRYAISLV